MDRETIKSEIKAFVKACEEKGYKLSFCALIPEMPNYEHTSYTLQTSAPWFSNKSFSEIFKTLVAILFETTSVEVRKKIYTIDIYNTKGDLHCMFEDLILQNEIGYDPRLVTVS